MADKPSKAVRSLLRDLAFREHERKTSGRSCWLIPVNTARRGLVVPVFAESFEVLRQVTNKTLSEALHHGLIAIGDAQKPPPYVGQARPDYVEKNGRPVTLTDLGREAA